MTLQQCRETMVLYRCLVLKSISCWPSAQLRNERQRNQAREFANAVVVDRDRYAYRPRIRVVDSLATAMSMSRSAITASQAFHPRPLLWNVSEKFDPRLSPTEVRLKYHEWKQNITLLVLILSSDDAHFTTNIRSVRL